METIFTSDETILKNIDSFEPEHIFKCGQAFRWDELEDGSFINVAFNRVFRVYRDGDDIHLEGVDEEFYNAHLVDYFDLNRSYLDIKAHLSKDETLKEAMLYGEGIRILNQEPFETIITFIISANNNIKRIKNSIRDISRMYGEKIENPYGEYYAFPTMEALSKADPKDLREFAKVGFRDERIVKASQMILNGEVEIEPLFTMDLELAREELMKLPGVGPKVCDCILLFAFKRSESFPVDVWIKRVMEELYFKKEVKKSEVAILGREYFGKSAGFAQQYLFFYGRDNKLGVK